MLLICMINYPLVLAQDTGRYHQHREAVEKPPCTHTDGALCSHLPLISIDTDGVEIPGRWQWKKGGGIYTTAEDGSDRISGTITTFDDPKTNNHLTDVPTHTSAMTVHVRGHSSRAFDKLGYRINLLDENGENNRLPLLGMDAHHEWALHGPILDKTLMRNYMWYNIAGEIMDYAPNVRFCELVLNGEYQGVYVLTEIITAGKDGSRLNLTVDAKDNTYTGYCLLLDRLDSEEYNHLKSFTTYAIRTKRKLEIVYPGFFNLTDEIYEGIKQDFSAFEKALYSYDYDNDKYGYETMIDVDSFVDYFLINEFTYNRDAGHFSTFIYKDIDGKFKMCVWDFNNACDNYQEAAVPNNRFETQYDLWFEMLFKDEDFTERCIQRYRELRKTVLSEEYLYNYIDEVVDYLGPAIDRNYEVWGYSFGEEHDLLTPTDRNPRSYEESIADLKQFIHVRGAWMDENIEILRQYSAESKVKKFNENAD